MSSPPLSRYSENRRARYDYETLETYQGGLVLTGQEAKSIRTGGAKLDGAHVALVQGELWLIGGNIRPYPKAGPLPGYDPGQSRKILVRKAELNELRGKTQQKGLTLVPFALYPSGRRIKLSFGLAKGRKAHDKREKLRSRDLDREVRRNIEE